jgi:hypothetical protein
MQEYIDGLSSTLIERYKLYLQTFLVDLWSEGGLIEFQFGYSLRRDSKLHTRTFKVGAREALTSGERLAIVEAMFAEIEDHIDETISATLVELN